MPGDPFKKVLPGDRLEIPAAAYNAFLDAVQWINQQRVISAGAATAEAYSPTVIRVRNTSGSAVGRLGILALGDPAISPTDNEESFQSRVIFDGSTPGGSTGSKWCVLLEPLAADGIGKAVLSGVVPVQLAVSGSLGAFASPQSGDTTSLTTGSTGSARVLWAEATGSLRWGVVRLGDGSGSSGIGVKGNPGGATSLTGITTLDIDNTYCTINESPTGECNIAMVAASGTAPTTGTGGVLTTSSQGIVGLKTFYDGIRLGTATAADYLEVLSTSGNADIRMRRGTAEFAVNLTLTESPYLGEFIVFGSSGRVIFNAYQSGLFEGVRFSVDGLEINGSAGDSGTDALGNVFEHGICTTVGAGTGGYTDESAQDAVGTILTGSDTIDFTYNDGTPSITAAARVQMSITSDSSGMKLSGDSASPGNSKLYGTNGSGVKGWYDQPTGTLDINGLTASVPALDDTVPRYSTSATANRKAILAYHLGHGDVVGGRLSLASSDPTGATIDASTTGYSTVYYSPYKSNAIILDDGTGLRLCSFSELSVSLGSGSLPRDIWAYWTGSAVALEILAWTNDTTRATGLTRHSTGGWWHKTGDASRRYLGTCRVAGGTADDYYSIRGLWNAYNRVLKRIWYQVVVSGGGTTWSYAGTSYRAAYNDTNQRILLTNGLDEECVSVTGLLNMIHPSSAMTGVVGIGVNSSTVDSSNINGRQVSQANTNAVQLSMTAHVNTRLPIGLNQLWLLENTTGTITFASGSSYYSGLTGFWPC